MCYRLCDYYSYLIFLERYHNRPILTNPPNNVTVAVGDNANLTCNFLSDLNPYVSWTKEKGDRNETIKVLFCVKQYLAFM